MFAIAVEEPQYKTYILEDKGVPSRLTIVPARGGMITSWQVQGQEMLYLDTKRFQDASLSVRGGIPILFPICGNLPENIYTHNRQTYHLKQHGFARTLPWEVTDQSTSDAASLTVALKSNATTRKVYPFDFMVSFTYVLRGNTLELRQRYTNHSPEPMPFSTGIHPYFAVADKGQLTFDLPSTQYKIKGENQIYPFNGTFDFEQDEIDFAFFDLSQSTATVNDASRNLKLTLNYDGHYSTLVFWTVKGKDFYCLEPWSSPRFALATGEKLLQAAPGAAVEAVIRMMVDMA